MGLLFALAFYIIVAFLLAAVVITLIGLFKRS